jgi:hypothetical protein
VTLCFDVKWLEDRSVVNWLNVMIYNYSDLTQICTAPISAPYIWGSDDIYLSLDLRNLGLDTCTRILAEFKGRQKMRL